MARDKGVSTGYAGQHEPGKHTAKGQKIQAARAPKQAVNPLGNTPIAKAPTTGTVYKSSKSKGLLGKLFGK